jgi:hypothetical protein
LFSEEIDENVVESHISKLSPPPRTTCRSSSTIVR